MKQVVGAMLASVLGVCAAAQDVPRENALAAFVDARLTDAILLYDQHFRVPETGQYLDALRLGSARPEALSSTAATGMGLISLALGHSLGVVPDAAEKAEVTLRHLLNDDPDAAFFVDRSKSGWFRHWFDARTGELPDWNSEKFSTIDTAILASGVAILGNYLRAEAERTGTEVPTAVALADELVGSVNWSTAVRHAERGLIHLVFYGTEERPTDNVATIPFDEYALLPCMAARYEDRLGLEGPGAVAWQRRFGMAEDLPMADYGDLTLLSKPSGSIPSHFTHQFAFHLCGDYAEDPVFLDELYEVMQADRAWFAKAGAPDDLWGLGAGSELVLDADQQVTGQPYGVARLQNNPNATASPAVMAGFLAVDASMGATDILEDLMSLWERDACRYDHAGLEFLWRCSIHNTDLRVNRVEAIDFSTWMLGLATAHPDLGLGFFQAHTY